MSARTEPPLGVEAEQFNKEHLGIVWTNPIVPEEIYQFADAYRRWAEAETATAQSLSAQLTSIKLAEDILTELSHRGPNPEAFRQRVLELAKRMESLSAQTPPAEYANGYHAAFLECANLMQRYVDEKWIGHPADIIRGSENLTQRSRAEAAQTPPDIELISSKVHEQWMESKRAQGVHSRKSESGEELMVPYDQLSEAAKELDRGSVRAVLSAIGSRPEGV